MRNQIIRELNYEELPEASTLLWRSFYESEKQNTSLAGMELFRELTSPISLEMNRCDGSLLLVGLWEKGELCGVGALQNGDRILLLYVHPCQKGKGCGKALLKYLEGKSKGDIVRIHASDEAVSFYRHFGYRVSGSRTDRDAIIVTPMEKRIRETK